MSFATTQMTGNLVADPELRRTPNGTAVANFRIANTPRRKNSSGEWVDGESLFQNVTAWGKLAENFAESARKGMRLIVVGNLQARSYQDKDGNTRTISEVQATEIGVSLTTNVVSAERSVSSRSGGDAPAPKNDPWAGSGTSTAATDEPPF